MNNRYGYDNEYDSMIETVEDWNDADLERKKKNAPYLNGESYFFDDDEELEIEEEEIESQDAVVELIIQDDKMSAAIFVHEPQGDGRDVTRQDILDALQEKQIVFGINSKRIEEIVEERIYRQLFNIAEGIYPVDGKNGKIKDYFPRERKLKFAKTANGRIDFKTMNLIHNVKKGALVCEITPPEEPIDGMDIFGNKIAGKRGKMPPIPQGKNIVFSEKKDKLLTACEGNLVFRSGRFSVEEVYNVAGDVNNAVGNIKFAGSVYIQGDVYEGYSVRAKGDIVVRGMVEGASLHADGDIILHQGMRGMKIGKLKAKGNITGKFLEDCSIYAGGNVEAEYIINSTVSCERDVVLTGRRGAFIGGRCAVYNSMKVKSVGTMSRVPTKVILGVTPELLENIEQTEKELEVITRTLEEYKKGIAYLSEKLLAGTITEEQKQKLNTLKIQEPVNKMRFEKLKAQAEEMKRRQREVGKSRLIAETVYPGVSIHIGDAVMQILQQEYQCMFYSMDGKIQKGMK